jgi:hypothetical protein
MSKRFSRYTLTEAELEWYMRYYGSPSRVVLDLQEDLRETSTWHASVKALHEKMAVLDTHGYGLESDLTLDQSAALKVEIWALDELVTAGPLMFSGRQ